MCPPGMRMGTPEADGDGSRVEPQCAAHPGRVVNLSAAQRRLYR